MAPIAGYADSGDYLRCWCLILLFSLTSFSFRRADQARLGLTVTLGRRRWIYFAGFVI